MSLSSPYCSSDIDGFLSLGSACICCVKLFMPLLIAQQMNLLQAIIYANILLVTIKLEINHRWTGVIAKGLNADI